jgi:hypothetical protein
MPMKEAKIIFSILFFIQGCTWSEYYYKNLNGGYYLSAIDGKEDMNLGYQDGQYEVGMIDATICAVYQNEMFILVKQNPKTNSYPKRISNTIFYIIPLKNKLSKDIERNFYGPLEYDDYKKIVLTLNINLKNLEKVYIKE